MDSRYHEERKLGCNTDAERDLLTAILHQNDILFHLPFLKAEHFVLELHQRLFAALDRRISGGEKVTLFTVMDELGDRQAARDLLRHTHFCAAPVETARVIVDLANIRGLIDACQDVLTGFAGDPSQTFPEVAAPINRVMQDSAASDGTKRQRGEAAVIEEILEDLKTRREPTSTGLSRLDGAMGGGLYAGRAYGFIARKKTGKTILASSISYNLSRRGVKHLFIAAEMGAKEIHERCLAQALNCSPDAFRSETRNRPEFHRRIADVAAQAKGGVVYQDAPGLTFDDLRRYVSSAVHTHRIEGFILDYWQLVGGRGKNRSDAAHLDEVAQWIADFGRKNGVWSVTMAQANQDGNSRGGEGIRLAFDQVYHLKGMGETEDISLPQRWLQMLDTRYTAWKNVGDERSPGLLVNGHGPYFEQP